MLVQPAGVALQFGKSPSLSNVPFKIQVIDYFHFLQVVEAAKQRPEILVQVGLEYRYMPPVAKLIEVVKSGTLGHVKMVAIREHRFPFLVKVWYQFDFGLINHCKLLH